MAIDSISYQDSGYFTKLIIDYLDEKDGLKPYYNRFPTLENFKIQIEEKQINYSHEKRVVLVSTLKHQYQNIDVSKKTNDNINLLTDEKTFTITTGHQLSLFTGPIYFLYKIISTINLCEKLKVAYPTYNFVPIYWMATEDHDFDEINSFNFKNNNISWDKKSLGPVGRLSTKGLTDVLNKLTDVIGQGKNAEQLINLFNNAYIKHSNLSAATRCLVNELFGNAGLVIIDGDNKSLKNIFIPYFERELKQKTSFQAVSKTNVKLLKEYTIQVNPREINLFYIEDDLRERIIFENNQYKVNNTKLVFTEKEIIDLLNQHPEKFSPNVILRPLYQEAILPNLCYIGGGGEIAYWLQLKSAFEENKISFPILLLRNSVFLITKKQEDKVRNLNLSFNNLFNKQEQLINIKTKEYSSITIDFSSQKEHLQNQFNRLIEIANQTDKSFLGAVKAQEKKQINGLEKLEKRLLKAEKKVHSEKIEQVISLQNELFPNQKLQERKINFSEFYSDYGVFLIEKLFLELNPLDSSFTIITF